MSKIRIVNEHNEGIVGILEKKQDNGQKKPRLVLIAHGILGHKDYLFQRSLAQNLPLSSFRLDFRGNGESEGVAGYANIQEDADDLHTVANYFEKEGYEIYAVIGHSRGALAAFKFAASREVPLPILVNISGRFKMDDFNMKKDKPEWSKAIEEKGFFDWQVKQRGRLVTVKVTKDDVRKWETWSNEYVTKLPLSTSVLTCHGMEDKTVPLYSAAMYANKVPNHTLFLMPGADHNYTGKINEVTKVVLEFFERHERNNYQRALSMGLNSGVVIPRWVDIDGVRNFRDIGGWPTKDRNGYIRERVVFRSGHLANMTPHGTARLNELNVKAVFDFRLDHESKRDGIMKTVPGIQSISYNLYEDIVKSPKDLLKYLMIYLNGPEGFAEAYMRILDSGKRSIAEVFRFMIRELSPKEKSSIIVHCTAGKDRTGVFIMVLLGLCGVDDEIIAREYDLSRIGYFDFEKDLEIRAKQVGITPEEMRAALSTSLEGMRLTIHKLKEKYGSFENYAIDACGLNNDEIQKIRNLMVVPIRFDQKQLYRSKI